MGIYQLSWALALALLLGTLVCFDIGRRSGRRRVMIDPEGAPVGTATIDAAVFALLGLLIAFTFSGAATRLELRRSQIVDEANAIGTAYLRVDLLPAASQPPLRAKFRAYVDKRLETYRLLPDFAAAQAAFVESAKLQSEIWQDAVEGCHHAPLPQTANLLLPALNDMFDITTTRLYAARTHPPFTIFVVLIGMTWVSAALAGYGTAERRRPSLLHTFAFPLVMTFTIYIIIDMEYPRLGIIREDDFDRVLVETRTSMDAPPISK